MTVAAIRPKGSEEEESEGESDVEEDEEVVVAGGEFGERIRARREEKVVKKMADPRRPTQQDINDHNRTHLPYINWCPHCVRARGRDLDHRTCVEVERSFPEFAFDYCFPGNEHGNRITVLVGRERATGMIMATVVPGKGSKGKFAADKVMEYIDECGGASSSIIVKTDQEPAIEYMVKDLSLIHI